jgi:hypothetical protein
MDSSRTITLPESWVFTAANETKRTETNARVLCSSTTRESKLGVTSTTSSAARLWDGPPLSISRMQDRQKYKAANSARAPATEGAFNDYVDTILSFFWPPTYLSRVDVIPHNVGNNWHFWPPTYPSHLVHLVFERPPDDRSWSKKGARRGHTWTCLEFVGEFF